MDMSFDEGGDGDSQPSGEDLQERLAERRRRRDRLSERMGELLLQGHCMTAESCDDCAVRCGAGGER